MSRRLALAVLVTAAAATTTALTTAPAVARPATPEASYSVARLAAAQRTLDARLTAPPAGVTSWVVDPAGGRVTVSVLAGDATALRAARAAAVGLPEARIVTVQQRPRPLYNLVGGQAIYSDTGRCSVGFSATKGSSRYVITAGHCTKGLGQWYGYNHVTLGTAVTSKYPTDDYGTISVASSTWTSTATVQAGAQMLTIHGSVAAAVGAQVCRSGSTTGYHCGVVQAKNATVNYGGGNVVYGLTQTNVCAEPGDSGGSFFTTAGQAQGVTSGGSGNCTSGGTTFFQPIGEILTTLGLTLKTA